MRAWHFVGADRRLRYGDGATVAPGYVYTWDGPLALCQSGLHASVRAIDALRYAPGPIVCRVEMGGEIVRGDDNVVAQSREVLWAADATDALRRFARLCALDVTHLWNAPAVVLRYLRTGDESIRAAAWDAASNAAGAPARAAARAAAWNAAWNAQSNRLHRMLMDLGRTA